ncbi:MAG: asparagine synthase (glutamine-hydrolyzing) [Phycisphaerales bacterium JB063]
MCGIAGAVGFVDDRVQGAVRAMSAAMLHRGPDGDGYWSNVAAGRVDEHGVALAHRRLSILDLSAAGAQPMHDPASGRVIAYNGEVYNYRALREPLIQAGERFVSDCDTEVVLRLLALRGAESVAELNGMFAFACWDPATRTLRLGRDRLGIKPLYITSVELEPGRRTVLFASELRSILAGGLVEAKIDPDGLSSYLWNGFVAGPSTFIKGVSLLDAGATVAIRAGDAPGEAERYWSLPSCEGETASADDAKDALDQAVGRRLIADVPLGVFLSGGIDSSAVAAVASRVAPGKVHTFNIGFPEVEYDESPHAARVAEQLGTEHRCIELTESHFQSHLDEALHSIDQPTFDGINTYFVSRAVREAGVTVALAGTGGDELFGGYTSYADLPAAQRWSRRLGCVPESLLRCGAGVMSRLKTGRPGDVPPQTRWGKLGDVLATRGDLVDLYQVSYSLYTEQFLDQLSPHADPGAYGLPRPMHAALGQSITGDPALHAISKLELSCFIGQRLLRDTDAASMAVSLEARVPLLDHVFIETIARMDPAERFEPLGKKAMLRRLALEGLDPSTFDRPKSGFVLPIDTWARQGLKDQVRETLHDAALCGQVGLDPATVARLFKAFQDGAPGLYWSRLWAVFVLLWWCREHRVSLG